jgi:multidrug efflux pump subunit AcrB
MLFWPGIMGEFMHFLPLTLIVTLSASLCVALVINPALCSYFMAIPRSGPTSEILSSADIQSRGEKPVTVEGFFLTGYVRILKQALSHKLAVLAGAVVVMVLLFQVWMLKIGIEKPVEFFPSIDPRSVFVNIDVPEGADLEFIDETVKQVEMAVAGGTGKSYEAAMALQVHETAQ